MDEVILTSDVALNKMMDTKGVKLIIIKTYGHEKTHYTAIQSVVLMGQNCLWC
jgi:hypothetical protein